MASGWRKGECTLEGVPFCCFSLWDLAGTNSGDLSPHCPSLPVLWNNPTPAANTVEPSGVRLCCSAVVGRNCREWSDEGEPSRILLTTAKPSRSGKRAMQLRQLQFFSITLLCLGLKGREAGETIHHFVFVLVATQNWGGEQLFCVKHLLFCILFLLILLLLLSVSHSIDVCF